MIRSAAALLRGALRRGLRPKPKSDPVDPRRHWRGEDVASPAWNVPLFRAAGLPSQCVTFGLESRDAIRVSGEVTLSLSGNGVATCRIGLAGKPGAGLEGEVGGTPIFRVTEVGDGKWHDLKFELSLPAKLTLRSVGSEAVVVSHPVVTRGKRPAGGDQRANNVIVLMLDSIAFDLLERYRERHGSESAIHRYFSKGASYRNVFSQAEWTYPSIYSMMTAQAPLGHGCFERFLGKGMPEDARGTLAQAFQERGFVTLGFSTSKMYHPAYNSHLGFNRFFYQQFGHALSFPQITNAALSHLESHRDCQNFLFLDYIDLHAPWSHNTEITDARLPLFRVADPNKEYDALTAGGKGESHALSDAACEQLISRCIARIRDVDLSLDTLFNYLERHGMADDTLVMLLADHGDLFRRGSQPLLCRSRTHVPMMLRGPNVPEATIDAFVSGGVDVMPTLLHLTDGTVWPADGDGRPAVPFGPERDFVISESAYEKVYQAAVRSDDFVYHFSCAYRRTENDRVKLVLPGVSKLFSLADEEACVDISALHEATVAKLHGHLFDHLAKFDVL